MSAINPHFTTSGRGRTYADKPNYLKVTFWADPANQFWESPSHTEKSKEYFRKNLANLLSNVHNRVKIQNSQKI